MGMGPVCITANVFFIVVLALCDSLPWSLISALTVFFKVVKLVNTAFLESIWDGDCMPMLGLQHISYYYIVVLIITCLGAHADFNGI